MKLDSLARALLLLTVIQPQFTIAAEKQIVKDLEYARVGAERLKLDLHICNPQKGPLIFWVHGGAWRSGSKSSMPLGGIVSDGFPVASVDYRLSTQAKFPAQIHDLKAAIRFLRARGREFGIDATRIVVAGDSAGGHLAALVGVTNRSREHEGNLGDHLDQNSSVQGIISFYGAANLKSILDQSTPHGLKVSARLGSSARRATRRAPATGGTRQPIFSRRSFRSAAASHPRRSGPANADQPGARVTRCL